MVFLPVERLITTIIATLALLDVLLLMWKDVGVDFAEYARLMALGLFSVGLGQFYRRVRRVEGIALAATSAGLYIMFTLVGSIFNYLLLPVRFPPIDSYLSSLDAHLGYDWASLVAWMSQYPTAADLLRTVYFTSLAQLLITILVLGFCGRRRTLHHFLLTGIFGALAAITFWAFFPSFGPSTLFPLSQLSEDTISLAVGPAYGAELSRVAEHGTNYVTPQNVLGLIAFPSVHAIMACMSVYFLGRIRIVGVPIIALNILMVPAILVQGGHHLVDLIGGVATFALAFALANKVVDQFEGESFSPPSDTRIKV